MRFKKCAIVSIAAMAMLCSSLTGLCYADNDVLPEKTSAAASVSESQSKLSEITKVKTPFENIYECLITDDGQVYYVGSNSNDGGYIFTLDKKGNVDKKVKLYDYCAGIELKQIGENICVLYNGSYDLSPWIGDDTEEGWHAVTLPPDMGVKDLYMVMLDKELNQLSRNDITSYTKKKESQYVGVNSTSVIYAKGSFPKKLYTANYDGSDKKVILDLNETDYSDFFIESIAVTEKYAALTIKPYMRKEKDVDCCAAVDLETGELTVMEHDFSYFPEAFGDTMIWRCTLPYDRGGYFETEEAYAKYREEQDAITEARFKQSNEVGYMSGVEYVIFKDGKFSTLRTEKPAEATWYAHIDNDGRIMTTSTDDYDNHYGYNLVKVYEDSKLVQKIEVDPRDYCPDGAENPGVSLLTANDGILSFRYSYKLNGKYYYDILLVPYEN